jgi:polyvinyl alcohol dehydrogenase (cytochrome)
MLKYIYRGMAIGLAALSLAGGALAEDYEPAHRLWPIDDWNKWSWREQELADRQWRMGGQNLGDWRNQTSTNINRHNVTQLQTKWVFTTGGYVSATPAVTNSAVYFPDSAGNFYAVHTETGALLWTHQIQDWTGIKGDAARTDPVVYEDMVILGDLGGAFSVWDGTQFTGPGARVIAVNAHTGSLIWVTQVESFPGAKVTGSPVVYNGVLYVGVSSVEEGLAQSQNYPCCVFRGSLVALDANTGKKLWQTYMLPSNNGLPGGYSGNAIWSSMPAIDPKRNSVYVTTGNNYSVPPTVQNCINLNPANRNCADPTDYFDSIVALDLETGKIKWGSRALGYDAWTLACVY